jgi:hypothetical protein
MPDDFQDAPPKKQGMSSTAKFVLILGSIAGVCLLACCGGVVFMGWKFQNIAKDFMTMDPEVVRQRTEEIIHIDIPDDYAPTHAMKIDLMNVKMKQVAYQRKGSAGSMLMIMETTQPPMQGASPKQQREQMRQAMRQQAQQQGQANDEIDEQSSESREFTINGESVPFEFIKGTAAQGGVPTRQVVGIFPGREGTVMLMLMAPESEYNEEEIVKMIESIRVPGGKASGKAVGGTADDEPAGEAASPLREDGTDGESTPQSSP